MLTHPLIAAVALEDGIYSNNDADTDPTATSNHAGTRPYVRNGGQMRGEHLLPKKYPKPERSAKTHCCFAFAGLVGIAIPIIIFFSILASPQNPANVDESLYTTICTDLEAHSILFAPIQDIFNVNVAFGDLSFSQAKFIDLVWDIVFSRGGQLFLGWITYKVHTSVMLRIMEKKRVSYDLFSTLSLSSPGLWHLVPICVAHYRLGEGSRWLLLWLMISTLWVVFWPTLTNALTGYVNSKDTMVRLLGGPGYTSYSTIANPETLAFQFVNLSTPDPTRLGGFAPIGPILTGSGPNISQWDFLNSMIQNKTEIVAGWQEWVRTGLDVGDNTSAIPIFYYNNQSYTYDYFQNSTSVQCITSGSYQWGFSVNILLYFIILNGLWVVGTYSVWTHLFRKSTFVQQRPMGKYRAVLDMAETIHKALGDDLCAYTDDELEHRLKKQPGVRYIVEEGENGLPGHICLTSKEEDGSRAILSCEEEYGGVEK